MRSLKNWPKVVFVAIPMLIITVDAVVLVGERLQPAAQKAIRLVKESNSRKENFTVQQYLYTTVYFRKSRAESVEIQGWRAYRSEADGRWLVEFTYSDSIAAYVAMWDADLEHGSVIPRNQMALDLSWH